MMFRSFTVIAVMTFFTLSNSTTATAEANLNIKDQIKAQLIAAEPMRGSGVAESIFDGELILISFFASW
jgi:hypothetical protein